MPESSRDCFVCQGKRDPSDESSGRWLSPRKACPNHVDQACFGDRKLGDLIGPGDSPGSLINFVINPVTIGDCTGWSDYQIDPTAILEQVHPSTCYFDFLAQHDAESVTFLHRIDQARDQIATAKGWVAMLGALPGANSGEQLDHLYLLWRIQLAVDHLRADHCPKGLETLKQARQIARESLERSQQPEDPAELPALVSRLLKLSGQRFAHLENV